MGERKRPRTPLRAGPFISEDDLTLIADGSLRPTLGFPGQGLDGDGVASVGSEQWLIESVV